MNIACAFDIESTSFYYPPTRDRASLKPPVDEFGNVDESWEKGATMYAFVLGMNGKVIIGRTWSEALSFFEEIATRYSLGEKRRAIFYIHNFSYEFQFVKDLFEWDKVFALNQRDPIKAISSLGIEFRCSYHLTGYSLEKVGEHLNEYKVLKLSGDLDYSLIRHSKTPLTQKEIGYIVNDGLVVMAHIQEQIEKEGKITNIPLTKTGYVRRYVMNSCLYDGKSHQTNVQKYRDYHSLMNSIQIKSVLEYKQLKRAFAGGFTHANAFYEGRVAHDVVSLDFTSDYPAQLIKRKYPMGNGELIPSLTKEEFDKNLRLYCCVFDCEFEEIEETFLYDHYISDSKCWDVKDVVLDNGRIVKAKSLRITLTEQDYFIIEKTYRWKSMKIRNFRRYVKDYIPRDFAKAILHLYSEKTRLKGIEGMEREYLNLKELLNSCFGMCVTDIARDENEYIDGEWVTKEADIEECLNKYNNNPRRFLAYQWGVWVTAYARADLWLAILELKGDYLYSDTDSVKVIHYERHKDFFDEFNANIEKEMMKAMRYQDLDPELTRPHSVDGKVHPLGLWDYEFILESFKTLGAKRYMILKKDGKYSITVSGVNKKYAVPYILQQAKEKKKDPFDLFDDILLIPEDYTGKNLHTYIDSPINGTFVDYLGNESSYAEHSSVHLEKTRYELSLSANYLNFLIGRKDLLR